MSELEKPKGEGRPESPTTAKALDFDDENNETPMSPPKTESASTVEPQAGLDENAAPPKPPRPLEPDQQAENTLKEAFPAIDAAVVKAVLRASGGKVEPAFNALLGMSDPDAAEPTPPPQPPRPTARPTTTQESQMAADERYARQLAEHYNGGPTYGADPRMGYAPRQGTIPGGQARRTAQPRYGQYEEEDRERSFIDDDLPVIRDNIKKGFLETQSTVNKWVTNLKKRIDGEDEDEFSSRPAASAQEYAFQKQSNGRRSGEFGRRSTDHDRYDADPQVLGDDFAELRMTDNETPRKSSRPLANPNLFKPTPPRPQSAHSSSGRRVSFQDGPPEEIDIHYPKSPSVNPPGGTKSSKWQPLAAVDPSPVADHDPFSLGDSEDEEMKKKDSKVEDSERLKRAAAEAMTDDLGRSENPLKLEPQEKSGSNAQKDAKAEEIISKPA